LKNSDILRLLFGLMELEDLCRVGATCRQWFAVAQSDEFWSTLDFAGRKARPEQVMPSLHLDHSFGCIIDRLSRRVNVTTIGMPHGAAASRHTCKKLCAGHALGFICHMHLPLLAMPVYSACIHVQTMFRDCRSSAL